LETNIRLLRRVSQIAMKIPCPLVFVLALAAVATASSPSAQDANAAALATQIVANHGGPDKLMKVFQFTETYLLAGREKGTDRTSIIAPPNLWYVGKRERVSEDNKGGVCHDVWMWTLAPLADPGSKLSLLPDGTIDGKPAKGLQVAGTIEPPMSAFFDSATLDLLKIEWKGEQFLFSAPVKVDGTRLPSKCVLIGKNREGANAHRVARYQASSVHPSGST